MCRRLLVNATDAIAGSIAARRGLLIAGVVVLLSVGLMASPSEHLNFGTQLNPAACDTTGASLLFGEEMTAQRAALSRSGGRLSVRSFHCAPMSLPVYVVARAFKKVAMFTRLSAMTPSPNYPQ